MKIDVKVVTGAAVVLAGLGVAGGIALTRGDSNSGRDQVVRQVNQTVSTGTSSNAAVPGAASPAAVIDTAVTPSVTMTSPNVPPVSTPADPAPAAPPAVSTPAPEPRGEMTTNAEGVVRAPAPTTHAAPPPPPIQGSPVGGLQPAPSPSPTTP